MVTSVLLAGANRATLMADSGEAPGCGGFEELTAKELCAGYGMAVDGN